MDFESLHHVSIPTTDVERSRAFYRDVLGLQEIPRPNFPFGGAWFRISGAQELHLIADDGTTMRGGKPLNPRDGHFAVRVADHARALQALLAKGFRQDLPLAEPMAMRVSAGAGYPQIYILDPDRNVIEINSAA